MTQPATPSLSSPAAASVVDALAVELVTLYATAEAQLIAEETALARRFIASTDANRQRLLVADMRRVATRIATMLHLRSYPLAADMAAMASDDGEAVALTALHRIVSADPRFALVDHSVSSATQIAIELAWKLGEVQNRILRFPDDAYRALTARAATALVFGRVTPAQAQAQAWRDLTGRGIVGFVDRRGGQWNLATYVEMAVRTAAQRAFNASHLARLTALGVQYATINHDGHPCPLCAPWEGQIIALNGGDGPSLDDATAAGLFHPNCRHVLLPYFPGISTPPTASTWSAADEARYRATQRLRYLERQVRAAKYQQAAALTPLDQRRAARLTRARQAEIRAHVDLHGLVRRTRREQLNLGNRTSDVKAKPLGIADPPQTITVVGGPRRGKSTLAATYLARGVPVYCGDPLSKVKDPMPGVNYLPEDLSFAGDGGGAAWVANNWFSMPGPWVLEGQVMARALRRWAANNTDPNTFPCDQIIVLDTQRAATSPGQEAMHKGVMTVWHGIADRFAAIVKK